MRASLPVALFVATVSALSACQSMQPAGEAFAGGDGIRPSPEYPRYWQYDDEPVVLIGGSREDNLFQIEDLAAHLDSLAEAGGNYVRNTMSSRDAGNVWPFARGSDGRYDLDRLNEEYFARLEALLSLALERGVIVQIEMWDRFDFAREPWLDNPYRPANNRNYTPEQSGLENEYPRHPGQNENPFFRSVPGQDDNQLLLRYQQAQVDRLLEVSLRFPNVLYTMDNETSAAAEWGAYWSGYVQRRAREAGVPVFTTEMWDAWDLKDEQHRRTLDHPSLYAFADVSQNNHNEGQEHWDNLQWVRAYTAGAPRPLNNVKIYGADTGPYGTDRDAVERFWRSLLGGAASVRFHRPPSGLGLSGPALASIRSARMLLERYDLYRAMPDAENAALREREPDEAYLSSIAGEAYAVYFPDGGEVLLDLTPASGDYSLRWLDLGSSRWDAETATVTGGDHVPLAAPTQGHWIALLTRR